MDSIAQRLRHIIDTLPAGVALVAVSKYHPSEEMMQAYSAGQRHFGESHAQELSGKAASLPDDIRWHFIGHLQRNKVKLVVPHAYLIHSIDSLRLLREVNRQAGLIGRCVDVLLQLHIAEEETKYGFTLDECRQMLEEGEWQQMTHIRIRGIMTLATNTDDREKIAAEFEKADQFFHAIRHSVFKDSDTFNIKSYGMSHDYAIAACHGSNMVRIGTDIFGERQQR